MKKNHRMILNQALGLNQVASAIARSHFNPTPSAKQSPKISSMSLAILLALGGASMPLVARDYFGTTGAAGVDGSNGVELSSDTTLTINLGDRVRGGNGGAATTLNTSGGYGIQSSGDNNTIINAGDIEGGIGNTTDSLTTRGNAVYQVDDNLTITNTGNITSSGTNLNFSALVSNGNLTVNNSGDISSLGSDGIVKYLGDSSITNSGSITGASNGIGIYSFGTGNAHTILNEETGTITGTLGNGIYALYGGTINITNRGTINGINGGINIGYGTLETLDNLQGSASTLTYSGKLPTNYNIIINSTSDFGKIAFSSATGSSTFGISNLSVGSSAVSLTSYSNVLRGITDDQLGFTGTSLTTTSNGYRYTLSQASTYSIDFNWDLLVSAYASLAPSAADTQASLGTQAHRLRSTFNSTMASANFANMNAYDCNLFDKNNMCISAGGRYTNIDNPSSNNSAAVVVLGYKVNSNIRIGGFLDQSINNNTPTGIQVSNKNPMMGAFAVWNKNADGLGYQVKIANAYQDKDVTSTRDAFGETGEAGTGKTNLNTQSYVGELSYAFQYKDSTIVRPYFALRYTNIKQDAYTETGVSTPLSYAKLGDRSNTALMGVKLNHALTPRTNLTASLGVEQDINHKTDQLIASGVADLTSENFNNNIKRTRPVASAGAYYAVTKTQRLSGEVYYQQLPFQSTGSATAYFNYMIGF
jgi:hypothetical protein